MDGWMDGPTDGWTDEQTKVLCVLQDFVSFGAAAQKADLRSERAYFRLERADFRLERSHFRL